MHSADSLVGPVDEWHEAGLPMGGQGCPEVAEFAVVEFAAALGRSTESGRRYLSHAVEGHYRLRRCWARLEAGDLPAWRLGFIADRTLCLSPEAAAFVDAHVAPVAHKIGPAQLTRLIEEAKARFDPEPPRQTPRGRRDPSPRRTPAQITTAGTVHVEGDLDLADAIDFNTALAADAHQQLLARLHRVPGRTPLHRGRQPRPQPGHPRPRRAHGSSAAHASQAGGGAARPPRTRRRPGRRRPRPRPGSRGPVTAEQVRDWCANPDTTITVQPVLDLADHIHVNSYQASARLKLQTQLRDGTCAFAFCFRPAEDCDCEHRVPHDPERDDGGPTCTCNQAPCCRRHHRAKTTGGWTYITVEPGVYLWRSPLGYQFLKDHTGTLDVTPDPERLRLAHEFIAHFGPTGPRPRP